MQQLHTLWNGLNMRRRIAIAGATIAVFIAVLALGRMVAQPGYSLLYGGLEGVAAGEVIQALEQRGVPYEVRGDAIFVPQHNRDETRMMLAGQGLPASSSAGYELLDGLSGFGTTSQMFDAAYWRAKEGELSRTISASPHVRTARVHIAQSTQQPFRRELAPTASVSVTPVSGGLPPGHARSVQFLVASAIPGLRPEDVSVIDGAAGIVLSGEDAESRSTSSASDREDALRRAVERLLFAHVGHGRAVVEVSVETVTESETVFERQVDPDSRVAIMTDSEERNSTSSDTQRAGVTVASNLPDGDGANGDGRSQSAATETRTRTNFEISELQRELQRLPGAIRRLSVAVMVDGVWMSDDTGTPLWQPRPEMELESLRELVASAVGYDPQRGDVITLRSLPFEPETERGSSFEPTILDRLGLDVMRLIQLALLALVSLALILFVLRPVLIAARGGKETAETDRALPPSLPPLGIAGAPDDRAAESEGYAVPAPLPMGKFPAIGDMGGLADSIAGPGADLGSGTSGDAMARLRRLIEERRAESVEILRSWMEEEEEGI